MTEDVDSNILRRFDLQKKLGKGAYGVVWQVVEKDQRVERIRERLALKKCFNCFHNGDVDAQRTYREVMYLQKLRGHDNIVQLLKMYMSKNEKDLYLLFDYMPTDLHAVYRNGILANIHIKFITYQILKALLYIHSAGIIHRDIKPSNILIDESCRVKLCDFGLARSIEEGDGRLLTDYVATRWYRPPEVLLCGTVHTDGIDIWAVACLLGELIRGKPLLPGNSTMSQIEKVLSLDFYSHNDIKKGFSTFSSPMGKFMLDHVSVCRRVTLKELLAGHDDIEPEVYDFIEQCLAFDPQRRYSADLCLSHEYLCDFHNPSYEKLYEMGDIKLPCNDNIKSSAEVYRRELEMLQF